MKKIMAYTFLFGGFFVSCVSAPEINNGRQNADDIAVLSQKAETELVFTFTGVQGINARLYYNGQLAGTVESGKTVKKAISNNERNILLKAQIGDEIRELRLSARGSTAIYINIAARRTPSGIVISGFNIANRVPIYSAGYVTVNGLNVRNDINADAALLDVLPKNCRVEILEEYANNWARIKYYDNKIGCVNSTYLRR